MLEVVTLIAAHEFSRTIKKVSKRNFLINMYIN